MGLSKNNLSELPGNPAGTQSVLTLVGRADPAGLLMGPGASQSRRGSFSQSTGIQRPGGAFPVLP